MLRRSIPAVLILLVCAARPAYAYVDPGTGSMVLQATLGAIAAAVAIGRLYWTRLKSLVTRFRTGRSDAPAKDG
jgi:hypothetical protein